MVAMVAPWARQSLTQIPPGTEGPGTGMWAINVLIFLLIHVPISSQGFPFTKHNYKPEGRGARMMKPIEISFAGHRMEQKRWMVGVQNGDLPGTITIDYMLHNNRTMKPLYSPLQRQRTINKSCQILLVSVFTSNFSYPSMQTPALFLEIWHKYHFYLKAS